MRWPGIVGALGIQEDNPDQVRMRALQLLLSLFGLIASCFAFDESYNSLICLRSHE